MTVYERTPTGSARATHSERGAHAAADRTTRRIGPPARPLSALLLGLAATGLLACGGSGKGLIPASASTPLQSDFEAISNAAQAGNGDCTLTNEAIAKTEQDFAALPIAVDRGLRERIREGIANLSTRARAMCAQPAATTTVTSSTPSSTTSTSTSTTSTPSSTSTTSSTSTSTSSTTPPTTTPAQGGGTPAEGAPAPGGSGENGGAGEGNGNGNGAGNGNGNGNGK
ncbi:MAG TPA: hypothetical protein VID29_07245 [Solirubrobacteraceae bacterium]